MDLAEALVLDVAAGEDGSAEFKGSKRGREDWMEMGMEMELEMGVY